MPSASFGSSSASRRSSPSISEYCWRHSMLGSSRPASISASAASSARRRAVPGRRASRSAANGSRVNSSTRSSSSRDGMGAAFAATRVVLAISRLVGLPGRRHTHDGGCNAHPWSAVAESVLAGGSSAACGIERPDDAMPSRLPVPPGAVHTVLKQRRITEGALASRAAAALVALFSLQAGWAHRCSLMTIAATVAGSDRLRRRRAQSAASPADFERALAGCSAAPGPAVPGRTSSSAAAPRPSSVSSRGLRGYPGRRQQVGLLVRAVPVRVPLLPEAGRKSTARRSRSWRSTPRTRATRREKFLEEFPVPYPELLRPRERHRRALLGLGARLPHHDVLRPRRRARLHQARRLRLRGGAGGRHPRIRDCGRAGGTMSV